MAQLPGLPHILEVGQWPERRGVGLQQCSGSRPRRDHVGEMVGQIGRGHLHK